MLVTTSSQQVNQKSLIAKQLFRNSLFNPFPDKFQKDPIKYINSLRGHGKTILLYRMKRSYFGLVQMSQQDMAEDLQIPLRTIQAWDQIFIQRGFYLKKQTSMFSRNHFYFNPMLQGSLGYKIRMAFGLIKEDLKTLETKVSPLQEYKLKNIYISLKSSTSTSTCTLPFESEIVKKRHVLKLEKEKMLSREKKNWILSKKHDPKIKEAFENPEIKKLLFPYVIEELTKLLGLGNLERYKLTAYDEQVLQVTRDHCIAELTNTRSKLKNKFGWFLKQCDKLNEAKNIKPDWPWFYAVCEILDINLNSHNFTQKSEKPKSSSLSEQVKSTSQLFNESKIEESKKASQIIGQKEILLEKYNGYIKHNQGMYKQTGNKCYLESIKRWEDNIKYLETYGIRSEEEEKVRMEEAINNFLKVFPFDPRQTA